MSVPRLDLSKLKIDEYQNNTPKRSGIISSVIAALTPRRSNSSLSNRDVQSLASKFVAEEDNEPSDDEYRVMCEGFRRINARPLVRDRDDREANFDAKKRHANLMIPINAFKDDISIRRNFGMGDKDKDSQVVRSLAMKQIKVLADLSKKLIKELADLETDLKTSQVLNSPRQIKDIDLSVQQIKITDFLVRQDRVIKAYAVQFFDIAKAYFEAIETLDQRHPRDSLVKKYFSNPHELFTPRGARPESKNDD
ncbi:MAG: hypothetical protein K1X28_00260 [Parachlamydiales bacterium]|nr:hypothetical protein [Parachlamydiales bacterium]